MKPCHQRRDADRSTDNGRAPFFPECTDCLWATRPAPGRAAPGAYAVPWKVARPHTTRSLAGRGSATALERTASKKWPAACRRPGLASSSFLFLYKSLHVDGVDALHHGLGASDFHDMGEMVGSRLAKLCLAIAARIVLLIHQHVDVAGLGQQTDGLAVVEAFLAARFVFLAMLADLQVTGQIDDLARDSNNLAGERLAIDGGAYCGGAPGL